MFSKLRKHFGIPGIIAVCALVFAMIGGAYAANNSGGDQKATASAKGKQGPRGKQGKPGKTGPAGPAGPAGAKGDAGAAGPVGPAGPTGPTGPAGKAGTAGAAGKSLNVTQIPSGEPECEGRGGALIEKEGEPASAKEVCTGKEGSPWTAGGLLPPDATQTGTWSFTADSTNGATILAPISFMLPLEEGLLAENVYFQGLPTPLEFEEACPGGEFGAGAPSADPGVLCVYVNNEFEPDALFNATFTAIRPPTNLFSEGTGTSGAILHFAFSGDPGEAAHGFGSWAVTGCGEGAPCPTL
jgi:Collagen triple helix repeat (20 copies)